MAKGIDRALEESRIQGMKRRSFVGLIISGLASIPLVEKLVAAPVSVSESQSENDWLIQFSSRDDHQQLACCLEPGDHIRHAGEWYKVISIEVAKKVKLYSVSAGVFTHALMCTTDPITKFQYVPSEMSYLIPQPK